MTDQAWEVTIGSHGKRDLKRLDRQVRQRIYVALQRLAVNPTQGQLRKLSGRTDRSEIVQRLRVGDWRVLVTLDDKARTLRVQRVLSRGRAYDR